VTNRSSFVDLSNYVYSGEWELLRVSVQVFFYQPFAVIDYIESINEYRSFLVFLICTFRGCFNNLYNRQMLCKGTTVDRRSGTASLLIRFHENSDGHN